MKIRKVKQNNRRKAFEVATHSKVYLFPYAKLDVRPSSADVIREVFVDKELGNEAFTYVLDSGQEGTVHIDHVLEYNEDPTYLKNMLLYKLTLETQKQVEKSPLSKREIIRRLGTSASQFYRLLDQTNYKKSFGQLVALLDVLDCEVEFAVKAREPETV
jgi:predicted XRE-type DNA-binding protein